MAQHDYNIANQSGAAFRADLNNALLAIVSQNSGTSAPSTTFAHQFWADTTTGTLKIRNAANSAWIELMQLDGTLTMEDGTALLPGLAFRDDLNTGLFSDAADTLGISTGGVERVEFGTTAVVFNDGGNDVDFRIEGDTNANLFFVDAGNDRVGIGTSSPQSLLHLSNTSQIRNQCTSTANAISFWKDGTPSFAAEVGCGSATGIASALKFDIYNGSSWNTAVNIDSSSRVGIGTTSPTRLLTVQSTGNANLCIKSSNTGVSQCMFGDTDSDVAGNIAYRHSDNAMTFEVNASERARIDSSGRLLVGTATSIANDYWGNGKFQVSGTGGTAGIIQGYTYNDSGSWAAALELHHARGSQASPTTSGNADRIGEINFYGYNSAAATPFQRAASIHSFVDGTPSSSGDTTDMPGGLVFSTTADGASSPTTRLILKSNGQFTAQGIYDFTSASAANVQVDSAGNVSRSTSSRKYKTDIETMEDAYADAILSCRPVWYRSTCQQDNPSWGWWGFIAEEVAEIDPRLVAWKTSESVVQEDGSRIDVPLENPEPEGVQYDRFVPQLLNLIKRQQQAIETLEAKVAALEGA